MENSHQDRNFSPADQYLKSLDSKEIVRRHKPKPVITPISLIIPPELLAEVDGLSAKMRSMGYGRDVYSRSAIIRRALIHYLGLEDEMK